MTCPWLGTGKMLAGGYFYLLIYTRTSYLYISLLFVANPTRWVEKVITTCGWAFIEVEGEEKNDEEEEEEEGGRHRSKHEWKRVEDREEEEKKRRRRMERRRVKGGEEEGKEEVK